jgi:hypothetical protein
LACTAEADGAADDEAAAADPDGAADADPDAAADDAAADSVADGAADDGAVVGDDVAVELLHAEMRMAVVAPSTTSRFESCNANSSIDPERLG